MHPEELRPSYIFTLQHGFRHKTTYNECTTGLIAALGTTKCSYRMLTSITLYICIANIVVYGTYGKDLKRVHPGHIWDELFSSLDEYIQTGDSAKFQQLVTAIHQFIVVESTLREVENKFTGGLTNTDLEDIEAIASFGGLESVVWSVINLKMFQIYRMEAPRVFYRFLREIEKDESLVDTMFSGLALGVRDQPYDSVEAGLRSMCLL